VKAVKREREEPTNRRAAQSTEDIGSRRRDGAVARGGEKPLMAQEAPHFWANHVWLSPRWHQQLIEQCEAYEMDWRQGFTRMEAN